MRERMRQQSRIRNYRRASAVMWAALSLFACERVQSTTDAISASTPEQPAEVTSSPTVARTSGGIDSAGNLGASAANTAPDGPVTTTLGDLFVNVHSETPLTHLFREAKGTVPEGLFLIYYLGTPDGQSVNFQFAYSGGARAFHISENGALSMMMNGREFLAKVGTVTIQPDSVDANAIKVSFQDLAVSPVDDPVGALTMIGTGLITGPIHRACLRASDVVNATQGIESSDSGASAISTHDEAWIEKFCSP